MRTRGGTAAKASGRRLSSSPGARAHRPRRLDRRRGLAQPVDARAGALLRDRPARAARRGDLRRSASSPSRSPAGSRSRSGPGQALLDARDEAEPAHGAPDRDRGRRRCAAGGGAACGAFARASPRAWRAQQQPSGRSALAARRRDHGASSCRPPSRTSPRSPRSSSSGHDDETQILLVLALQRRLRRAARDAVRSCSSSPARAASRSRPAPAFSSTAGRRASLRPRSSSRPRCCLRSGRSGSAATSCTRGKRE